MPTWILSVLIVSLACAGCARRSVLFESKRDLMPCDEYGGKVSMGMRVEPVVTDKAATAHRTGIPVAPVWAVAGPQLLPRVEEKSSRIPGDSVPIFFAPPGLGPPQGGAVTRTGFTQSSPTDDTIFASYPGPLPLDPAYSQSSPADPEVSVFERPRLSIDSLDIPDTMGGIASCDRTIRSRLWEMSSEASENVWSDHRNYYDRGTMAKLACGLVLGSVLANTSMDQEVHDWYQQEIRSAGTDHFADFWKTFGEGHIFIPSYACLAFACKFLEDRPVFGLTGDFSARVTRAYVVGAPPMLFMQFMLGASRPNDPKHSSYWDPFQDTNSVSGHAFVGAVPFITAARMTDSLVLKSGLYACSALPGCSRINDDHHYLSQVILGWWMAYLACEAVDHAQLNRHGMTILPIASTEMVGFGAICEY